MVLGASGIELVQHLTVSELKRETTNNRTTAGESSTSTADEPSFSIRLPVAVGGSVAEGGEGSGSEPVSDDGASSADEFEDTNDVIMEDDVFIREMPSRPQPLSKYQ